MPLFCISSVIKCHHHEDNRESMSARVIKRLLRKCFFKYWKSLSNYSHACCSHSATTVTYLAERYIPQNGVFMVKKYQLISTQNSCSYLIPIATERLHRSKLQAMLLHVLQMCELELSFKSIWCQPNAHTHTNIDRVCVLGQKMNFNADFFFLYK